MKVYHTATGEIISECEARLGRKVVYKPVDKFPEITAEDIANFDKLLEKYGLKIVYWKARLVDGELVDINYNIEE